MSCFSREYLNRTKKLLDGLMNAQADLLELNRSAFQNQAETIFRDWLELLEAVEGCGQYRLLHSQTRLMAKKIKLLSETNARDLADDELIRFFDRQHVFKKIVLRHIEALESPV